MQGNAFGAGSLIPVRKKSTISMTALIDLVFILLMFFMLTSTFVKWKQVPLSTASVSTENTPKSEVNTEQDILFFRLFRDGSIDVWPHSLHWQNAQGIDFTDVTDLNLNMDLTQPLLLIPEHETQLQDIVDVTAALKKQGFTIQLTPSVEVHE
ncbi:MAG TPA: biopolymer transporter ExbD [Gammaproteobacteria bacterium]|nr:biopolymer transporter ExbD [Gammaproteobacteria bacterium]MBK83654.1 biopolymer transporter ExbD [Gammaproteobacteria bacterium]HBF07557.1 biopolymer transporter ExbD [Gammaproteobacteria bacterium]HCK92630.1 biopolymer transporter ExbD [Gammaproteobacteria bacterium]|tara:strand:+ start:844 stop:1302 length:459 start_codon:yes stop_codon:yes gene_type:complete